MTVPERIVTIRPSAQNRERSSVYIAVSSSVYTHTHTPLHDTHTLTHIHDTFRLRRVPMEERRKTSQVDRSHSRISVSHLNAVCHRGSFPIQCLGLCLGQGPTQSYYFPGECRRPKQFATHMMRWEQVPSSMHRVSGHCHDEARAQLGATRTKPRRLGTPCRLPLPSPLGYRREYRRNVSNLTEVSESRGTFICGFHTMPMNLFHPTLPKGRHAGAQRGV